ncbi:unnamed protein product [Closterium sp. Yama58-4]|nr:unnamed protein product [Closterium sp. Yama58-4]
MASLSFSTAAHRLSREVSVYRLRSSPRASPFHPISPPLLGRFAPRNAALPLKFNPLCLSALQASSPRQSTSCNSLDDNKTSTTVLRYHTEHSASPGAGQIPPSSLSAALQRPLALTSAAAISAALAFSALPALAADIDLFGSISQGESVAFLPNSGREKGMILASASLAAPSLEGFSELTPSLLTATVAPSIVDNAVVVSHAESVSDVAKSGPILQLAARDAASHDVVKMCSNLVAACGRLHAHQFSSASPSFPASALLPLPLHLSPRPSTALHQLAASLSSLAQPATELTAEAAAKPAAPLGGSDAAGNLGGQLGEAGMTLLLLVIMTAVCETAGDGDGLAGQLALLAVGGIALLSLHCPPLTDTALIVNSPVVAPFPFRSLLFSSPYPPLFLPHPSPPLQPFPPSLPLPFINTPINRWGPALLILACNALLWIQQQTRFDAPQSWSNKQAEAGETNLSSSRPASGASGLSLSNRFFTPPVLGVLAGLLIGATPLSQLFLLPRVTDGLVDTSTLLIDSGSILAWLHGQAGEMAGSMHCFMEAASFLDTVTFGSEPTYQRIQLHHLPSLTMG